MKLETLRKRLTRAPVSTDPPPAKLRKREPVDEKPMDDFMAVFNCHVNKAHDRAKADFIEWFGPGSWKKSGMEKAEKDGIMIIFKRPPTAHTEFYVKRVAEYVNENRRGS